MVGHVVSLFDLSPILPVGGGLLVWCSLPGLPVVKLPVKWLLWCLVRVDGFGQCASPNIRAQEPQLLSPCAVATEGLALESMLHNKRSHPSEKPVHQVAPIHHS